MGSGVSAGLGAAVAAASDAELKQALSSLPAADRDRLNAALGGGQSAEEAAAAEMAAYMETYFGHRGPYNEQDFGPAPDYSKPESWFHFGEDGNEGAEMVPEGEVKPPSAERPADCFYIHETTYIGQKWNQPLSETYPDDATKFCLATGPSAFNGCCRIYAPRFRQSTLSGMGHVEEGRKATELAYSDVKAAFEHFLKEKSDGRPLIIASHSQGSLYCIRLLQDFFEGKPLFKQLVAVYAIAAWVPLSMFEGDTAVFKDLKVCKAADSVGCVISYTCETPDVAAAHAAMKESGNAEGEDWYPKAGHKCGDEWRLANGQAIVGTNPLTWASNGMGPSTPEAWLGMVDLYKGNVVTNDGPIKTMDEIIALVCSPEFVGGNGIKITSLNKLESSDLKEMIEKAAVNEKSGDLAVGPLPNTEIAGSSCEESSEHLNFYLFYFNLRANLAVRLKAFQSK